MKRFFILIFIAFTLLSCREEVVKNDEIYLKFQPKSKSVFFSEITYNQVFSGQQGGNVFRNEQDMYIDLQSSTDTSGTTILIDNTYRNFKLEQRLQTGESVKNIYFDSQFPDSSNVENDEMKKVYSRFSAFKYSTIIARNGKLQKLVFNKGEKPLKGSDSYALGVIFPEYDIRKGEDWTHEILERDSIQHIDGFLHFTLIAFNDSLATIKMEGEFTSAVTEEETVYREKIRQSGEYVIWIKTGWVKNAKIQQQIVFTPSDKLSNKYDIQNDISIQCVQKR